MVNNITMSYGPLIRNLQWIIPPDETVAKLRTLSVWIGEHPDGGDAAEAVRLLIKGTEGLQPPIEMIVITTQTSFWTYSLASIVQAASYPSIKHTQIRLYDDNVPRLQQALYYFQNESLHGPPTYSHLTLPMDSLVFNGKRNSTILPVVNAMRNHLRKVYVVPPWDGDAFLKHQIMIFDEIIIILSALDGLDNVYLPPGFFDQEYLENFMYDAFVSRGNTVPTIEWW
ncbi:hypothetical protein JR316_0011291 [Psilocybe cubensis]|uniref:Uncharacterized protein n=2 Tax=Psilocybe cubensis TaxID=181762 RepID=A0A8H7XSE1_PSICU|nr:hypothetical protein JR316_0011291 [Psilocybe cubensis]KAH9475732.1 hypothetical protein JR316_0011291 [Psilocybe cubensis]